MSLSILRRTGLGHFIFRRPRGGKQVQRSNGFTRLALHDLLRKGCASYPLANALFPFESTACRWWSIFVWRIDYDETALVAHRLFNAAGEDHVFDVSSTVGKLHCRL